MKALTLVEYNRLVYGDAPDPKPGAGEVLIRVKACGICGSDVHGMDGIDRPATPADHHGTRGLRRDRSARQWRVRLVCR